MPVLNTTRLSAEWQYCNEMGAHFSDIQEALEKERVLIHRNAQKVLGAGTDFGKGQVRCWMIDVAELGK